jgi:hypothetical protein
LSIGNCEGELIGDEVKLALTGMGEFVSKKFEKTLFT